MVTMQRGSHTVVRNRSRIKKVAGVNVMTDEEDEEDVEMEAGEPCSPTSLQSQQTLRKRILMQTHCLPVLVMIGEHPGGQGVGEISDKSTLQEARRTTFLGDRGRSPSPLLLHGGSAGPVLHVFAVLVQLMLILVPLAHLPVLVLFSDFLALYV
ncbi:hypothetical protein NDU88_007350 [Pleurodeles waltl]|uniref:Uncharacterized protein n=1 Tax=Pleurodeles waltl TaxID=8319 RepID=A0AAV7LRT1_PLEWA|nr:hypothetical protein NDU88_007350 [Pleurodeles waltl]